MMKKKKNSEYPKYLYLGKREKITVYYDNFQYFQPNTHKCGDCHVRAVAKATDKTWLETFDGLHATARINQDPLGSCENITEYLKPLGFTWHAIKAEKGKKKPTVAEFAKEHPDGKYVLRVSNHVVGAEGGKYYDIWDCGDKSLYGYWEKK